MRSRPLVRLRGGSVDCKKCKHSCQSDCGHCDWEKSAGNSQKVRVLHLQSSVTFNKAPNESVERRVRSTRPVEPSLLAERT
jgi:hypothetical protein